MILCISDLHLGSPVCRTHLLLSLIKDEKWTKIIINGDLIDHGHFKRFSKKHWEVLKALRKTSKHKPVILVKGNHDRDAAVLCEILGLEFVDHYQIEVNGKKIWFEHGDRFDVFVRDNPILSYIAGTVYNWIQRFDKSLKTSRWLKMKTKKWLEVADLVANNALRFCKEEKQDAIVCGHVHMASKKEDKGRMYWNTGSFCESPSFFLTIDDGGQIELHSCEEIA